MAINLSNIRAQDTALIELTNGDGAALIDDAGHIASITIHGPGSKQWQQADAERNRSRAERMSKNRRNTAAVMDGMLDDEITFLTNITVSLNNIDYDGEFTDAKDMARAIYSDVGLGFIRDQISSQASDWSVFTKGSAKS